MLWQPARSEPGQGPQPAGPGSGRRAAAAWPEIDDPEAVLAERAIPAEAPDERSAPRPMLFDEADLASALTAAAAESRLAERQAVASRAAERVATALEAIALQLGTVDELIALRTRQFREATAALAALATETVGRGGGRLAARLADALASDCLARFDPALALTIEVAPEIADPLAATLEASPALRNRPGRISVEAVASLASGEARLVWPDGEADWSSSRLHESAADLVRRLAQPERRDRRAGEMPSDAHNHSQTSQGAAAP
jgi:hypothetical protein